MAITDGGVFVPPWERPHFQRSTPDDVCPEPGCSKTVREHIAECHAIVSRPGTVFTRPQRVDTVPDHERKVREQALAMLRRG